MTQVRDKLAVKRSNVLRHRWFIESKSSTGLSWGIICFRYCNS